MVCCQLGVPFEPVLLVEEDVVNAANKNNSVNIQTDVTSGVLTEAAVVDLTFSQDTLASYFSVNGQL